MKIKNQKKLQRRLNFYYRNFGIGKPYTVLIDGTFCFAASENRIPIKEQIPKFLDDPKTRIVTTPCIIMEVEKLGKIKSDLYAAWLIVKQFAIIKCGHEGRPVPASECIQAALKENPCKYILALQDVELKQTIQRTLVGTPILFLNRKTPVLAQPTQRCEKTVKKSYSALSSYEVNVLKSMKRKYMGEEEEELKPKKKIKIKKKRGMPQRVEMQPCQESSGERKGRRRHRKKRENMMMRTPATAHP